MDVHTESTDMKDWLESGWTVTPLKMVVIESAPPAACVDLKASEFEGQMAKGFLEILRPSSRRSIDMLTHQTLLEQSLRQYEEIWGTLAEK